jgi:hypothetical protein
MLVAMRCVLVLVIAIGCGGKKEPPPEPKKDDSPGLLDRAKSTIGDKAKEIGGEVSDKAKSVGGDAVAKAKEVASKAGDLSSDALASGKSLKERVHGKLAFVTDSDFSLDAIDEADADREARIAGMKQLKVGDYTIGVAQDSKHPLGSVYKWQLRLVWRLPATQKTVRLAPFTNRTLEELDLAANALSLISAAETVLKMK